MRSWTVLTLVGALGVGMALGQKAGTPVASPHGKTAQSDAATSPQDVAALRSDVQHMRALIMQMQNNLGSVTSTTSPLKHQFELEIELWQLELGDKERQLARAESQQR